MPSTLVVFYQESGDDVPVLDWLKKLRHSDELAYGKCVAAIERLATFGHELRRPLADLLKDGVYELRVRKGHVNYRILYFFHRKPQCQASPRYRMRRLKCPISRKPFAVPHG